MFYQSASNGNSVVAGWEGRSGHTKPLVYFACVCDLGANRKCKPRSESTCERSGAQTKPSGMMSKVHLPPY